MSAARASIGHGGQSSGDASPEECRAEQALRRELDRRAWGALLRSAIESAGASVRAVADALGANEASVRRWISGEVSAPLDLLDRLPPTVAERLMLLAVARVRIRSAKRVTPADMMKALEISMAALIRINAEGQDPRAAVLQLADISSLVAGGLNGR